MKTRGSWLNATSNFKTVDSIFKLFLLGIKNPKPVVSRCVFFINFQNRQQRFFSSKQMVFTHTLVYNIPQLTQTVAKLVRHVRISFRVSYKGLEGQPTNPGKYQ